MSATNSRRLLTLMVVMAMTAALIVAGCGGSGGHPSTEQNPPSNETPATENAGKSETESGPEEGEGAGAGEPNGEESGSEGGATEEEGASEGEAGGAEAEGAEGGEGEAGGAEAGGATAAAGMEVFTSNCGTCHTLAAAGTSGNVGPNLDELMPSESTVQMQVENGGGAMPAFGNEGILTPEEVKDVAAYVSSEAGK